jgi:hypothetical protein
MVDDAGCRSDPSTLRQALLLVHLRPYITQSKAPQFEVMALPSPAEIAVANAIIEKIFSASQATINAALVARYLTGMCACLNLLDLVSSHNILHPF